MSEPATVVHAPFGSEIDDFDDYVAALDFALNLRPEFIVCRRRRRHDFENGKPVRGWINPDGSIHQETACDNCGTVIVEDITTYGYYITRPQYRWPEGYLKTPGAETIGGTENIAAAMRVMKAYERLGMELPDTIRRRPRKKRNGHRQGMKV